MPLARRKKVIITKDEETLQNADPDTPVYQIPETGEIFRDYSSFVSRMSFYGLKIFQCETSGKGNLTFFEALESEKAEARMLDARFPEPLKAAILKSVQWQLVGRLDHLVEAVYDRFKDRYFEDERVFVDFALNSGEEDAKESTIKTRYSVRIIQVTPPAKSKPTNGKRKATQMLSDDTETQTPPHDIYGDLKIPVAQVNALDNPKEYVYTVQLTDEAVNTNDTGAQAVVHGDLRNGATQMDVHCDVLSRDRLAFSKSILKRFIRECVDRDAAVASPWIVKPEIATKYGISVQMPDEIRRDVDAVKRSETEKRKRISEVKELPSPSKRAKRTKPPLTEEEKAAKAKEEEAARAKKERDEMQRQALTGCKRAVSRWPVEDLDVILTEKEKASGKPVVRPLPHRTSEFAAPEYFESFLMAWNFITTYGHAFNVSPFSLDTLEAALHHSSDEPCFLIDCLHTGIISSCRSVAAAITKAQIGVTSLSNEYGDEMETDDTVDIRTLCSALIAFGSGWEKKAVNHDTWCNALVSILKEHATVQTLPQMRPILAHLLFQPAPAPEPGVESTTQPGTWIPAKPKERYFSMAFHLKIAVLAFLCDLSATGKAVHNALETCEASLTEMRKEKVELKRQQKKVADQILAMSPEKRRLANGKNKKKPGLVENGDESVAQDQDSAVSEHDSDEQVAAAVADLSMDTAPSEAASDDVAGSSSMSDVAYTPSRSAGRSARASLRFKAQDQARVAKEKKKKVEKEPPPLTKQEEDELRQYEEEAARIEQALNTLELEFRQYLLLSRMQPLGYDRFHSKIWWFDGVGCMTLVDKDGQILYGTGKLFIQGPSQDDIAVIDAKAQVDPSIGLRREAEEGEGLLGVGEWAWYETPEEASVVIQFSATAYLLQIESYIEWLNTKGVRENALEKAIAQWKPYLVGGMEARINDLNLQNKSAEARRGRKSNASTTTSDTKAPYLNYVNLYATK
ncbi:SubName: Full=Related to ITC1-subunit of Isw2 chromatin remodelling complex {ECO:0000313/EMBL:CCA67434.1} [Serendipita indica DSM 11827]|nr:SubName: Full=Related to ITC1-subunit of Isw2 chromatin remodelling complex {ECO:0000313/EMBL:CCA67434.1} [Serendipita indica DSM 11827]